MYALGSVNVDLRFVHTDDAGALFYARRIRIVALYAARLIIKVRMIFDKQLGVAIPTIKIAPAVLPLHLPITL